MNVSQLVQLLDLASRGIQTNDFKYHIILLINTMSTTKLSPIAISLELEPQLEHVVYELTPVATLV